MQQNEIRYLSNDKAIIRSEDPDSKTIAGYAAVFGQESEDLGGFREVIVKEAFDGLFPDQDVIAVFNHKWDEVPMARYTNGQGSLKLSVDDYGLRYEFTADEGSQTSMEVLAAIKRGDINTSSFAFRIAEGGDEWKKRGEDDYLRTLTQLSMLKDVSPVTHPAYPQTSVAARKLEEIRSEEVEALEKAKKEAEEAELKEKEEAEAKRLADEAKELEKYYKELNSKLDSVKGDK